MFSQLHDKQLPYWTVSDGRSVIAFNDDEDSLSKSEELLQEVLDNVLDAYVIVKISERPRKDLSKGGNTRSNFLEYKIQLKAASQPGVRGISGNSNNVDELHQEIKKLRDELHKKELEVIKDNFQRQIDELKEKKNDPMTEMGMQVLSGLLIPKKTVAVAGAEDEAVKTDFVEKQKRIKLALVKLSKVDPDLDQTMTLLAEFAVNNPDQYKSFIPMLKSM